MEHNVLESVLDRSMEPRDLPFALLQKITDDFSEERRIGDGGFAVVYKGVIKNGEVAVKRINSCKTIDETPFEREVTSLMQVKHDNIVRFLGFCFNTVQTQMKHEGKFIYPEYRERLLCFEYINGGSLDKHITDELRGLEWDTRFNIIKGICNGLEYLHVKMEIIHMDLKPANILLDNDMTAKITDFGLSRMVENLRTITTNRCCTMEYCAPEYILHGKISNKYDVYSLGVIIIELVTGYRYIRNKNNVLRRWRHRWNKSGEETLFRSRQVDRLIEIGLLCQENDPKKRSCIPKVICDINELESTYMQLGNSDESTVGQIGPYAEDDMLGIEPLELHFPFELNTQMSCSFVLTNETNAYIAFSIGTTSSLPYYIEPTKGIVTPRNKHSVNITLRQLDKTPQDKQYIGDIIVRSTKLSEIPTSENTTEDMFTEQEGRVVDEVNLTLSISATGNQDSLEDSKENLFISDDLIQFDPPELCFPFVSDNKVLSFMKIVNVLDHYVGFNIFLPHNHNTAIYIVNPWRGILPPRSTQRVMITRVEKQVALKDMHFNDMLFVWNALVTEHVQDSDLHYMNNMAESKLLPIVLTKTSTSAELIQFDPPELSFPLSPKSSLVSSVNIVNITDFNIGFKVRYLKTNAGRYFASPHVGILPPRSTQRLVVKRVPAEKEVLEDMQCQSTLVVWNMIVAQGCSVDWIGDYSDDENIKKLPIILKKPEESSLGM